jgi:four helix bundle suffix protein
MLENKNSRKSSDRSDTSDKSDPSDKPSDPSSFSGTAVKLLPKHGGYRRLRGFRVAERVYDLTVLFCDRFIDRRSRTHDQMVQAARSGVQNIAEGSVASGTSKKSEIKLTNVARASLEELQRDYEDFLRQRGLNRWDKGSPKALEVRNRLLADQTDASDPSDRSDTTIYIEMKKSSSEHFANTMVCLINQATYLLHRQLQRLEKDFLEKGGFSERLYAARSRARLEKMSDESDESDKSDPSDIQAPRCPSCGRSMKKRTARRGPRSGQPFWGCSAFPACRGVRPDDRGKG